MRLTALLEYAAIAIGIGAMLAGHFFAIRKGFNLGVFLVGAGLVLAALNGLITRRVPLRPSDDPYEDYAGLPAVILALMALMIGAATIGSAYLLDQDQWHATVQSLLRRPAPLLAAGGLILLGVGVLMLLNPRGHHTWTWRLLVYAPRVTIGLPVLAAGVACVVLGAWEWQDPKAYNAFVDKLPQQIRLLY
ncbi:MAG TPA: hypothetical protein VJQ58_11725 [Burkholderiales bacterium]|nr:hypothetical protein [Burkholderiales bacterium]